MIMKKQLLFFVLMMLPLVASAYDFEVDGIFFNYDSYSQSAIVASDDANGTKYSGTIVIPNTITYKGRTMSVTAIGNSAFRNCKDLVSVHIPSSVVRIEGWAFRDSPNLRFLSIPSTVNSIGGYVFSNSLTTLVIEDGQEQLNIDKYTFYDYYPEAFYIGRNCSQSYGLQITFANILSIGKYVTSLPEPEAIPISSDSPLSTRFLKTIYSLSENPSNISGSFSNKHYLNSTLYVPKGTKEKYMMVEGWKNFFDIEEMDISKMWNGYGEPPSGDNPNNEKCEKPTIGYSNGKLTFASSTEGATCYYSITDTDIKAGSGSEVQLAVTYNISVYAAKSGYENSETATATLCWIDATPQTEGITNGVAQIAARPVLVKTDNGFITVEGVDDRTNVSVYTTDGKQVGSAISQNNIATIATSIQPGSIAIVKVGEKSVKVIMK